MEPKAMTYGRKEACKVTGMSIPSLDAFMRREENPLPHFHVGRKVLIPRAALEQWLLDEAERTAVNNGNSVR